jgi:hypothetical protein
MKTHIPSRKSEKKRPTRKISSDARRLIVATVRRCKSERAAAKLLKLKSHNHLRRMLRGEMSETPEMRAAVVRARARAQRAFLMSGKLTQASTVDVEELERAKRMLDELIFNAQVIRNAIDL